MNGLNKPRKVTSASTFDFSILHPKLSHNRLLMVLNSLIDFCFDGGEIKHITVNNYGAHCIKNIKDNVICLNKQQKNDELPIYFLIFISLLALRSSVRLLVFLWGLI